MTLRKTVPRKPSASHRKRHAAHHTHSDRYLKPYWPYLPMVAIVTVGLLLNSWLGSVNRNVLGYATEMSISGLVDGTNAQRAANGLGALALNGTLNQAAQAKAQDMVNNDYWAHTSPSGVTPWYWITTAGYSYQTAGENLAYGFATSSETITGWMNSPGHRANILNGSYREVGFGVANATNFVGSGPQTIVVAMYAQPYAAPAPAPAPTPAPAPAAAPTPAVAAAPAPTQAAEEPLAETEPVAAEPQTPEPVAENVTTKQAESTAQKPQPVADAKISRVEVLTAANVAWGQFAVSMIASLALLLFLLRHSFAWHKFLVRGERFILHHPLLDILFVAIATVGFILSQTSGLIK